MLLRKLLNVRFGRILPQGSQRISDLTHVDLPIAPAVEKLERLLEL